MTSVSPPFTGVITLLWLIADAGNDWWTMLVHWSLTLTSVWPLVWFYGEKRKLLKYWIIWIQCSIHIDSRYLMGVHRYLGWLQISVYKQMIGSHYCVLFLMSFIYTALSRLNSMVLLCVLLFSRHERQLYIIHLSLLVYVP